MDYRYTELDYAKSIYENGFQSDTHQPTELRLVATYMRRILGYKPKQLKEEMETWAKNNIVGYKREIYFKMMKTAINKACQKGSKLINIDHVDFSKQEMDYLCGLEIYDGVDAEKKSEFSYECQKLLFTLLFKMKVNKIITEAKSTDTEYVYKGKYFQGGQKKYTELKKLAKLPEKLKINEDIIYTLSINNLVTPMFNGLIKLDFMEQIYKLQEKAESTPVASAIVVQDYDSVGWYFDYYTGDKKISFCENCGTIFKKKSNRQLYCCEECSTDINRSKTRKRMKRSRESDV